MSPLHPALSAAVRANLDAELIAPTRAALNERRRIAAEQADTRGVTIDDQVAGAVPVRIYRGGPSPAPAVVYCHAGAFVLGNLDTDHQQCVELARRGQCTVVSVDYRLAPEHRYPAAYDDAATVLNWLWHNAVGLGIDAGRVAVAGSSAGAALAAGLAQQHADALVLQLLHQPVLDDRDNAAKARFTDSVGFDSVAAELMWTHYLGAAHRSAPAVPGRRESLAGVPAAFISCAELDPLRDEALDYARRLLESGVSVELHLFARTCHGFDLLAPNWAVSQQLYALQGEALRCAFTTPRRVGT